jgi:hypothetical protein
MSHSDLSERRLVFLVGAPRSGTTWLQLMLASSEHVATCNETHLFTQYLASLFDSWDLFKRNPVREIGLSHVMEESEFLALIRNFADGVISRILANKPDASVILEKTPDHVQRWRHILKVYPNAYFLLLVRDPRAVVASSRAASSGWGSGWAPSSLVKNCTRWKQYVSEGQQIKDATSNFIEVRYEDLKSDCAVELRRIFDWMGITLSIEKCSQIAERNQIHHLRSGGVNGAPWDLSREPEAFFRRGEIDGWKEELTARQIYLVESMTRDLMDSYQYMPTAQPNILNRLMAVQFTLGVERVRALTAAVIRAVNSTGIVIP